MQTYVPLDQIDDNPYQRRTEYGDLEDLAQRIQAKRFDFPDTYGLMQVPLGRIVLVEPLSTFQAEQLLRDHGGLPAGMYRVQLAFGHRRLRAFRLLAEQYPDHYGRSMPVTIRQLTDDQMLDACWSENRERRDLTAVEEAELLAEKLARARETGGNQQTVADAWGLSRPTVANRLRLLELPAEVQQANRDGRLSERQALALLPVYELEAKLNGTAVEWGDTDKGAGWYPRSPAGYVSQVLADPAQATSDAIRDYTQSAIRHAGDPLGDAFAVFEAGEGRNIIQSTCKGCPKRVNQHCLHRPCYAARSGRYHAAIPEWATRETGLPFSDKAADETDYTHTWAEREALSADWKAGRHDGLVIGFQTEYYSLRPYTDKGYVHKHEVLQDWRLGLILGRKPQPTATAAGDAITYALATRDELARWRKTLAKADRDRADRAKQALRGRIAQLANDAEHPALRVLIATLDAYWLRQQRDSNSIPTAEEMAEHLADVLWKRAETIGYESADPGNRTPLRRLLQNAGMSPDIVDPPDEALRLLDIGQQTLLGYDDSRQRVGRRYIHERLDRLRDAITEFDAAPAVVSANEELTTIATYLAAAVAREERLLAGEEKG